LAFILEEPRVRREKIIGACEIGLGASYLSIALNCRRDWRRAYFPHLSQAPKSLISSASSAACTPVHFAGCSSRADGLIKTRFLLVSLELSSLIRSTDRQ
jgi:hypothetical protein